MKRKVLGTLVLTLAVTAAAADRPETFGDALRGLTPAQQSAFTAGLAEFIEVEGVDDGLGPVFNDRSCAACHNVPATGGGSEHTVTRFGTTTDGAFDPLAQFGGSLIQAQSIGPADAAGIHQFQAESVPPAATIVIHRRTTPLYGLGLVEAVPDADLVALAAREAQNDPRTAGRVAMVADLVRGGQSVGKFGWKSQVPTLMQFSADAYLNEMGITSPLFPNENCPNGNCAELQWNPAPGVNDDGSGVRKFADFMALLAPPAPAATRDRTGGAGERTFAEIGCASCHTATLHSGASDVAALSNKIFHPYSDFLLHDMGALGDGIAQGAANGREMRTAPLWGLRTVTRYLHDGRASTMEEAILAHDGQGRPARDRFAALDPRRKANLLSFLGSL
jgi:CxxC motif-containing protein (DUF1111 family)